MKFYNLRGTDIRLAYVTMVTSLGEIEIPSTRGSRRFNVGFSVSLASNDCITMHWPTEEEAKNERDKLMEALENDTGNPSLH